MTNGKSLVSILINTVLENKSVVYTLGIILVLNVSTRFFGVALSWPQILTIVSPYVVFHVIRISFIVLKEWSEQPEQSEQ